MDNRLLKMLAAQVTDAIQAWVKNKIAPLETRLATHSLRFATIENRVVTLGERKGGGAGAQGPPGPKGDVGPVPASACRSRPE